jgi:nicotinamide mononucleotide transporter
MDNVLQFFLDPYQEATFLNKSLELIAALFGILSVYFAKKENILVFPTGIVSTAMYVYLLTQWAMYGDLIINVYYTVMSIYGWYLWSRIIEGDQHIPISRTDSKDKIKAFIIFAFTAIFVILVYRIDWNGNGQPVMPNLGFMESFHYAMEKLTSGSLMEFRKVTPYLDTFTTGAAFAAMWLMANKKIENWLFWIAVNLVSVPMYFVKGFGFTGIQYFIFLILAIFGYIEWKKNLDKKTQTL